MAYQIIIQSSARKELKALPKRAQRRIGRAIDALAQDPRPPRCTKLTGSKSDYRIRVGNYRVLYHIADDVLIVYVIKVADRKNVYR